jgi:hypothetical protein
MNKLVYICVPNQFVIGDVFLKLLIKRLAVAMVNKTVVNVYIVVPPVCTLTISTMHLCDAVLTFYLPQKARKQENLTLGLLL